ncbi:hypothetical protein ACPC54_38190 [Kitasatospora sp. NPDC094028]
MEESDLPASVAAAVVAAVGGAVTAASGPVTGAVVDWVRGRLRRSSAAAEVELAETRPDEESRAALESAVARLLAEDPEFRAELLQRWTARRASPASAPPAQAPSGTRDSIVISGNPRMKNSNLALGSQTVQTFIRKQGAGPLLVIALVLAALLALAIYGGAHLAGAALQPDTKAHSTSSAAHPAIPSFDQVVLGAQDLPSGWQRNGLVWTGGDQLNKDFNTALHKDTPACRTFQGLKSGNSSHGAGQTWGNGPDGAEFWIYYYNSTDNGEPSAQEAIKAIELDAAENTCMQRQTYTSPNLGDQTLIYESYGLTTVKVRLDSIVVEVLATGTATSGNAIGWAHMFVDRVKEAASASH